MADGPMIAGQLWFSRYNIGRSVRIMTISNGRVRYKGQKFYGELSVDSFVHHYTR